MELGFILKKVAGLMCMPLSMAAMLLLLGVVALLFRRQGKVAVALLLAGLLIPVGAGLNPLANGLLGPLESRYDPILRPNELPPVRYIVVLGGGHQSDPRLPSLGQLSDASRARLLEGIRLHGQLKRTSLVFTGGAIFDQRPHAQVMGEAALQLGVGARDIIMLPQARDTTGEALAIREMIDANEPFVLVTSASHMPRAMRLFQQAGLNPLPGPADYLIKQVQTDHPAKFFPSAAALRRVERALYEYLGLLWVRMYEVRRLR